MKNRIIVFNLITIFILIAPVINANTFDTIQEEPEEKILNTLWDEDIDIVYYWGGRFVNVLVKNTADKDLYGIPWTIGFYHWHGGSPYLYGKGRIGNLPMGETTVISMKVYKWGFMEPKVSIHVGEEWVSPFALWFGPFIIFRSWWQYL